MNTRALGALFNIGQRLLDRVIPDPAAKAAAQIELLKLHQTGELATLAAETELAKGQLQINAVEAANANVFVSGWRPFLGWVCGAALAYEFLLRPLVVSFGHPAPELPMGDLMTLLLGMLGLGGMRSFEKIRGVAAK